MEGLLIWSIIEIINFFVQMKLNKFAYIYIQNHFEIILKNNEKNTWKFPKNLEKSWNFVSLKKWEPCTLASDLSNLVFVIQYVF